MTDQGRALLRKASLEGRKGYLTAGSDARQWAICGDGPPKPFGSAGPLDPLGFVWALPPLGALGSLGSLGPLPPPLGPFWGGAWAPLGPLGAWVGVSVCVGGEGAGPLGSLFLEGGGPLGRLGP